MRQFIITEQQLAATLAYLGERPFREVEQAVSVLRKLPEVAAERQATSDANPIGIQAAAAAEQTE